MFKRALEANTDREYKDVCKMCRTIALNKGLRSASNGPIVYEMFRLMLPNLIFFMKCMTKDNMKLDCDLLGDAILEIMEMFNGVVNGTHVNVFMLDECSQGTTVNLGQEYCYEYFKLMVVLSN